MRIQVDPTSIRDYRKFIQVKQLPVYSISGEHLEFPDTCASRIGLDADLAIDAPYRPLPGLFDYQVAIVALALQKQKYAVFADCGLGKTLILLEWARHVADALPGNRCLLIVSPLMVCAQTVCESQRFYAGTLPIEQVRTNRLAAWMAGDRSHKIGITNYEAITDKIPQGDLGALVLDESSMLKSHYGRWGQRLLALGAGLEWKLCLTGTPAPNDRIEYANHAVFLDRFPTVNSFLARYFVNRGETSNRWELKPHAIRPFYRSLSDWCLFLTNPATYGWTSNAKPLPPIEVVIHQVDLTPAQVEAADAAGWGMFGDSGGGITRRATLARIAKGFYGGKAIPTNKPAFIRDLVDTWPDESTIIWCEYNDEQAGLARILPHAGNIEGKTPSDARERIIEDFKAGRTRVLISKPKILGFGLNLQVATRQVFSTLQDSYEKYYQAVKRSNRVGSTRPLRVHIPVTEIERPMLDTVLRKAACVDEDTREQERIFKELRCS